MAVAIYVIIVLMATTIGACAGIGGGIIIKPCMDMVGLDHLRVIGFYSANAVFAMTCLSSLKRLLKDRKFNYQLFLLISLSSVLGGFCGNELLKGLFSMIDQVIIGRMQSVMLCVMLIVLCFYYLLTPDSLRLKNRPLIFVTGWGLGLISSFLSIGGGPANVALFGYLFGFPLKICVTYSLATIFFAQGSQLASIALMEGYSSFPCEALLFIIPTALAGSHIGSYLYRKMKDNQIRILLVITMVAVIGINLMNIVM